LSSYLLSKNVKDFLNYNVTCCFHGCKTQLLTVREEQRLKIFENRVLQEAEEDSIMRSFIT
jgi:hypothetical protein